MLEIKKYNVKDEKLKAVVYGSSGVGKTTFAGNTKNSIFASAENGLRSIAEKKPTFVVIKSLKDLKDLYNYLANEKHNFETVIIDSITEINDIIKNEIEKKTGKDMQIKDWGTLAKDIKNILRNFRDLPMNVLFIAQEMADEKDENGVAMKVVPSLNGKASTEIAYFMDIVGYIYVNKNGERKILTKSNSKYLTKDRTGIINNDEEIDFQVWIDKAKDIVVSEDEVVGSIEDSEKATTDVSETKSLANKNLILAKVKAYTTIEECNNALNKLIEIKLKENHLQEIVEAINEKIKSLSIPAEEIKAEDEVVVEEIPEEVQPEGLNLEEVIQA